jgi:hypothetical protein
MTIPPRAAEDDYRPDRVALFYDASGSEIYRLEAHDASPGGAVDLDPPRTISRIEVHAAKDIYA